jgi:outer membrane protein OmpA-like peptidoglycan-associated protein
MKIKKKSAWTFEGSSGGDLSVFLATASTGTVNLKKSDGHTHTTTKLHYGAVGAGADVGIPVSLTFSTTAMPDVGSVYVTDNVSGPDLTLSDFDGLVFVHGGSFTAAPGVGGAHTILFFGIPWTKVPKQIVKGLASNFLDWKAYLAGPAYPIYRVGKLIFGGSGDLPNIIRPLAGQAKGILIMKGMWVGASLSAGLSVQFGYLSSESSVMPWQMDFKGSPEDIKVTYKIAAQDTSIMRLPGEVLFGFDKDRIGSGPGGVEAAEANLRYAAFALRMMRPRQIFAEGYTDSVGTPEYNVKLSERRATAVRDWLLVKGKLGKVPISALGFGEDHPIADNATPSGRELNRRVELRIYS